MIRDARDVDGARGNSSHSGLLRSFRLISAFALAVTALGAGAGTVLAFGPTLSCTGRTESQAYARWGDTYNYFLMPNGNFESGSANWALSNGAAVVWGNEPWRVTGSGNYNLQVPPNGVAESRTICVSMGEDTIRLFVYNQHVSGSILHVEANVRNPVTGQIGQTAFDVNGDAAAYGYSPTMRLGIPAFFGNGGTEDLTLRFTTRGAPATWWIDDVFVDPFKSY